MSIVLPKIESYKNGEFQKLENHYQGLKDGQEPKVLFITCADSRVCPQEITQAKAGELFVLRNAGNLIEPAKKGSPSSDALTLEYGVSALGVDEIVVCGHTGCGAMKGLQDTDSLGSMPYVQKALEAIADSYDDEIKDCKNLDQLIRWNVDKQLSHIASYPFVKEKMKEGKLKLFGIVYNFHQAEVEYKTQLTVDGEFSNAI